MPIHMLSAPGQRTVVDNNNVTHPVRASDNTAVIYCEWTEYAVRVGMHQLGTPGSMTKPATHSQ